MKKHTQLSKQEYMTNLPGRKADNSSRHTDDPDTGVKIKGF